MDKWFAICIGGSAVKNTSTKQGLIPRSGRSPEGGNGNLLQYSYLGSHVDRGALQATAHGQTTTTKTSRRRNDKPQLKYVLRLSVPVA